MRLNKKTTLLLLYFYSRNRESIDGEVAKLYRKLTRQGLDGRLEAIANRENKTKTKLTFVTEKRGSGTLVTVYEGERLVHSVQAPDDLDALATVLLLKIVYKITGKPTIKVRSNEI